MRRARDRGAHGTPWRLSLGARDDLLRRAWDMPWDTTVDVRLPIFVTRHQGPGCDDVPSKVPDTVMREDPVASVACRASGHCPHHDDQYTGLPESPRTSPGPALPARQGTERGHTRPRGRCSAAMPPDDGTVPPPKSRPDVQPRLCPVVREGTFQRVVHGLGDRRRSTWPRRHVCYGLGARGFASRLLTASTAA
jgi:hypothetical protein